QTSHDDTLSLVLFVDYRQGRLPVGNAFVSRGWHLEDACRRMVQRIMAQYRKAQPMKLRRWTALVAVLGAFGAVLPSTGASAISFYTSTSMTCQSIKTAIRNEGAVILRYWSPKDGKLKSDRYVRNQFHCYVSESNAPRFIPALDTENCRVFFCDRRENNCRRKRHC
ncbi:MAG: hypothetical protein AAF497_23090, partial [Planctomycetota bacterium]